MERSYTVAEIDRMRVAIALVDKEQTGAILQAHILAHADPDEVISVYMARHASIVDAKSKLLKRQHELNKQMLWFPLATVQTEPESTPEPRWYEFWK